MLTERRARILSYIVDEYVSSAQPVASEMVARNSGLAVSPATVRNEMMRLEEEGYILQPHPSAGRLPSDKGYRYYVEALMVEEEPPAAVRQMIRHQFHQAARALEEWARLAAAVLAHYLENVAVVTGPQLRQARLHWLELVEVQEMLALLIVVLQEARVGQQTLPLPQPLDHDDLSRVARKLNGLLVGLTATQIRQRGLGLSQFEGQVAQAVAGVLESAEEGSLGPAFRDGLRHLAQQPEFAQSQRSWEVLDILEERNLLRAIPFRGIPQEGVAVIIGGEHPEDAMRRCSLVLTRYGRRGNEGGALGVVGPTRLHYPRAVAMVRFISSLMDELTEAYFG